MQPLHYPIGLRVEGPGGDVPHPILATPICPRSRGELGSPVRSDVGGHAKAGHPRGQEGVQDGLSGGLGAPRHVAPHGSLNDLLQESWENQVKVQPGVDQVKPVEGGLHQCEPGEGVLCPEWRQFHLGWRYVLVCRRR